VYASLYITSLYLLFEEVIRSEGCNIVVLAFFMVKREQTYKNQRKSTMSLINSVKLLIPCPTLCIHLFYLGLSLGGKVSSSYLKVNHGYVKLKNEGD